MIGLGFSIPELAVRRGERFDPATVFENGENGGVYVFDDTSKLWQDSAKTVQADGASEPVRVIEPTFGSGDATAPSDAARPLLQLSPNRIVFDLVDDDIQVPITTDGWLMVATTKGTYWGQYKWSADQSVGSPASNPRFDVVGIAGTDDVPTEDEDRGLINYFRGNGALEFGDVGAATDLSNLIRDTAFVTLDVGALNVSQVTSFKLFAGLCSSLTTLDVAAWDTSSAQNISFFVYFCTNLTALDVSGWDTSQVINLESFVRQCTSLAALDVSGWDTGNCVNFSLFCELATSLTTLDISGWVLSSANNFSRFARDSGLQTLTVGNAFATSPCINYTQAFLDCDLDQASVNAILVSIDNAGTSNGTLGIEGGTNAAPTGAGATAKANLIGRGWAVTTN